MYNYNDSGDQLLLKYCSINNLTSLVTCIVSDDTATNNLRARKILWSDEGNLIP